MSRVQILSGHGAGDSLLGFQAAYYAQLLDEDVTVGLFCRNEVFNILNYVFSDRFNIKQLPESLISDYQIEKDPSLWSSITKGYDENYFILPDLLNRNPHCFNFSKYNTSPSLVSKTSLLHHKWKPEKAIFINLISTTDGYRYSETNSLANFIAKRIPDYKIYVIDKVKWANKMEFYNVKAESSNIIVLENPDYKTSIDIMTRCEWGIYTDNGFSHLAYQLGQNRILLDPQWNRLPWIARWREDYTESIPINTSVIDISKLISNLIKNPPTQLLPRKMVLDKLLLGDVNWGQELIYKF